MKVIKVLGDERCYLMDNGQKIPFKDKHLAFPKKRIIETVTVEQANAILNQPKKRRGRKKR